LSNLVDFGGCLSTSGGFLWIFVETQWIWVDFYQTPADFGGYQGRPWALQLPEAYPGRPWAL